MQRPEFLPEEDIDLTPFTATSDELAYNETVWARLFDGRAIVAQPPQGDTAPNRPDGDCWVNHRYKMGPDERQVIRYGKYNQQPQIPRVAWWIHRNLNGIPKLNNEDPQVEVVIRHLCGNKLCFNPSHLRSGTQRKNGDDERKLGLRRGENNSTSTISDELAKEIRWSFYKRGDKGYMTKAKRAEKFGVSVNMVNKIDNWQRFRHVPDRNNYLPSDEDNKKFRDKEADKKRGNQNKLWAEKEWAKAAAYLKDSSYPSPDSSYGGTPCRIWKLAVSKKGYNQANVNGARHGAHSLACSIAHNFHWPGRKETASHLCNHRRCVNGDHLEFTLHKKNMGESKKANALKSKLTPVRVKFIRNQYYTGKINQPILAKVCGVSEACISNVVTWVNWTHVTDDEIEANYVAYLKATNQLDWRILNAEKEAKKKEKRGGEHNFRPSNPKSAKRQKEEVDLSSEENSSSEEVDSGEESRKRPKTEDPEEELDYGDVVGDDGFERNNASVI